MIKFIGIFVFLAKILINSIYGDGISIIVSIIAIFSGILISVFSKHKIYSILVRIIISLLIIVFVLNLIRSTVALIYILYFLVVISITITICYFTIKTGDG